MASDPRVSATAARGVGMVSRRGMLLAVGLGGVGALAGCDSGPDQSAETRPAADQDAQGSQLPEPLADTDLLLHTWLDTQHLQHTAKAVPAGQGYGEVLAETRRILSIQQAVLGRLIRAQQGDGSSLSGAPNGGSGADDAASTSGASASPGRLAAALSPLQDLPETLGGVSGSNLPTLLSLYGARFALAEALGRSPEWGLPSGPTGAASITLLAGLRQAVYGFEVLAARASGEERERYRSVLSTLRPLTRTMTDLAGPAAPAAPLGYGWEARLNTVADRRRAAQRLGRALPAAAMAGSSARAGDVDAIVGTVQVMATVVQVSGSVGVPLTGFPGLSVPRSPDM
ncbi:MAG: hypothetical protein WA892_09855 [Ornithinimicrobium sp.]